MISQDGTKHYKSITFGENSARLRMLKNFREIVVEYFENSRLDLESGSHIEKEEAKDARAAINLIKQKAYITMRLADVNPRAASTPSLASGGHDKNVDLILNIFNLGRNGIPSNTAVDYIERAIDVYKENRLDSLMRTISPFFWAGILFDHIFRGRREEGT